jgi:hypothetical protein
VTGSNGVTDDRAGREPQYDESREGFHYAHLDRSACL